MSTQSSQHGEGKLGLIIGLIVLMIAVFVVVKTVPIYLAVGAFNDEIINIAEGRGYKHGNTKAADKREIAKAVVFHANKINLLLDEENVITPDQVDVRFHGNNVIIKVAYTLKINYGFYTYVWDKQHEVQRQRFGRI